MNNIKMIFRHRLSLPLSPSLSPQRHNVSIRYLYNNYYVNYSEKSVNGAQTRTVLTNCEKQLIQSDCTFSFLTCVKTLVTTPVKNNLSGVRYINTTKSDKMITHTNERPTQIIDHHFKDCIEASDQITLEIIKENVTIYPEFISEEEEKSLFNEVEPYLKRLHYEYDHWDDAIEGYRETERKHWSAKNKGILKRHRDIAFEPGTPQLPHVHILDLAKSGCVKAHIDSVRFCGNTISGICLLSPSVMRFVHDKDKTKYANVLLNRRTLYAMKGRARYEYTHAILGESESRFRGEVVPRDRRIVVICRNAPTADHDNMAS